jgi:hypothetical protein
MRLIAFAKEEKRKNDNLNENFERKMNPVKKGRI